ncbi:MAG: protein-disulfide reductase DsbD domain-containing protein [Cyclobacteriaceae bacterium]
MVRKITSLFFFFSLTTLYAQPTPVEWYFRIEKSTPANATLVCTAVIQPGWHIYSQSMSSEGPLPTSFDFEKSPDYLFEGPMIEKNKAYSFYDSLFNMEIKWLSKVALFARPLKLLNPQAIIKGKVNYMACNHETCLPPQQQEFFIQAH